MSDDIKQPEPLLFGHMLAFMYLTFAHYTDGKVTNEEMAVVSIKIGEWMDEGDDGSSTVSETIDWYNSVKAVRSDVFGYMLARFKKMTQWNDDQLTAVLDDLVSIAKADGNYDEAEKKWIRMFAEAFELDYKV